jgi:hypothetical protein
MADLKGAEATTPVDGAGVDAQNMIAVAMEDLIEDDREALEKELEEEMAERWCKKLVCFQKTHYDVIKKAEMTTTSGTKVSLPLSPEDLVHLVDVSVASKYGACDIPPLSMGGQSSPGSLRGAITEVMTHNTSHTRRL